MNRKPAAFVFLGVCLVLAALLLFQIITPVVSGVFFAVALAVFGGLSKGFRRK